MTRSRRGSTKPLSFFGIKFKTYTADSAPAKSLNESTQYEENNSPERAARVEPTEGIGKSTAGGEHV